MLSVNWDDLSEDIWWRQKIPGDKQVIYTYTAWRVTKWVVNIRVTIRPGFSGDVNFSRFQSCFRGNFLIFQKCPIFWSSSIFTLNFSVVVIYVIVRSSRRPRFNFRPYFHIHFQRTRTHARTARLRSCGGGRAVCYLVRLSILSHFCSGE